MAKVILNCFYIVTGTDGSDCVGMTQIMQTNMIISQITDHCLEIFVYGVGLVMFTHWVTKHVGRYYSTTKKVTSILFLLATSIRPTGEQTSMRTTPCCAPWTGSLTMPQYSILRVKVSEESDWRPSPCKQAE